MNKVNIDLNRTYTIAATGSDIVAIIQALGELPHKIAGPLESKIVEQISEKPDA